MSSEATPARPADPEEYDEDDLGGTGGEDDAEETYAEDGQGGDASDRAFDEAVGALEEMLIDDEFCQFQSSYLSAHCGDFEHGEENKLSYTPVFDTYVSRMEEFISRYLQRRVAGFSMESFLEQCESRGEEQLSGDVFDVLTSMSDFGAFKETILAHKDQHKWSDTNNSAVRPAGTTAAAGSTKNEQ